MNQENQKLLQTEIYVDTSIRGAIDPETLNKDTDVPKQIRTSGRPYKILLALFKTNCLLLASILTSEENLSGEERTKRQIELYRELKEEFFFNQGKTDWDLEQEKNNQ